MASKETGDSLDSVENLIKKHEDFLKTLSAQEDKAKALDESATKLVGEKHYAATDVSSQQKSLSEKCKAVREQCLVRRQLLENSLRLQQFERDILEAMDWINEKMQTAQDGSYKVGLSFGLVLCSLQFHGKEQRIKRKPRKKG